MRATSFVDWNDMKQIISLWCQEMLEIWRIVLPIKSYQPSYSILHLFECSSVKLVEKKWYRKHWTWFLSSGFTVPVRMKIYWEKHNNHTNWFTITRWDIYGHKKLLNRFIRIKIFIWWYVSSTLKFYRWDRAKSPNVLFKYFYKHCG